MTKKTIVVCGYGPGISEGVARKFGAEGFQVALVARNAERVDAGARALSDAGITAKGFACDLGDAAAVTKMIGDVRGALGPITVVHYNAYAGVAGDLLTASIDDVRKVYDVGVVGLVAAVQASLEDLRAQKGSSAVLVTGGGFAYYDDKVDAMVVQYNAMGLSLAKAAQHKLASVLHHKLKPEGIYVGEIVVLASVKGTAFDGGQATLEASKIADKLFGLYTARDAAVVQIA